ncbi:PfkB family carbohydrate kinase [Nocardia macrotermitis]|uniref:Ribokinase n=1 Tax=Nocardia macrotermitis TaxID=2585198 RepID=A0A7K0D3P7_9NOCA|nr:PfkB family carbohydrate kinase [Nocardia macrotermitis]MQY20297.1 Bifunctional ribokinase/ribose-5-phosphate isomerase A [Nocardia macrotermitis]
MTVVVVGSVNVDVVSEVERLPAPGETVLASGSRTNLGGKGSNQAVAAAQAGGQVEFVARVGAGADPGLWKSLLEFGIGLTAVREVPDSRTGTAYITVAGGENQIVVDPGANFVWESDAELDGLSIETGLLDAAQVVVAQFEIPVRVVEWISTRARRFILNAAPATRMSEDLLRRCDPLVVNESELAAVSGSVAETPEAVFAQARALCLRGVPSVVATLGAAGSVWARTTPDSSVVGAYQPAPQVNTVDSTGAGDAFVGALATALAAGTELGPAVTFATAAGALAVQSPGTHGSYPTGERITEALAAVPEPRTLTT